MNQLKEFSEMKMRCSNCGWSRVVSPDEVKRLLSLKQFYCTNCKERYRMLDYEIPVKMKNWFFSLEKEIYLVLTNSFVKRQVKVWLCNAEFFGCADPLDITPVYLVPLTGDIPIYLNNRYYVIELKFSFQTCRWRSDGKKFVSKRTGNPLWRDQWNLMLDGGGVLVIVAEPLPSEVGLRQVRELTKGECRKKFVKVFKNKLATGEIPYDVFIYDHERFKVVWEAVMEGVKVSTKQRSGRKAFTQFALRKEVYRDLPIRKLKRKFPDWVLPLTMQEIRQGGLADAILDVLRRDSDD